MIAIRIRINKSSQFVFQDLFIVKGLQVVLLVGGGPQGVGIHVTDLGHILNQAKVVLSLETKSVFNSYYSNFVGVSQSVFCTSG